MPLKAAAKSLADAVVSREQAEKELRGWLDTLDDVSKCEAELEATANALKAFSHADNLKLLCWTVRRDADQLATICTEFWSW